MQGPEFFIKVQQGQNPNSSNQTETSMLRNFIPELCALLNPNPEYHEAHAVTPESRPN